VQVQKIIGQLKPVNDAAELGAKLLEGFNNKITKNEKQEPHIYSN